MKLFSTNTCYVPKDLNSVIRIADNEGTIELTGMSQQQVNKIWQAIESLYRTGNNPMISICLRRQGQIVLNRSIGYAQGNGLRGLAENAQVATPDTPVCLFSTSKIVTAMLIHLLAEQGAFDLQDSVSRYIPEFGRNGKKDISILSLLSHRAGVASIGKNLDPELMFDPQAILKKLYQAECSRTAGLHVAYHAVTAGFIFGELVQRVTGQNISQFLHDTIEHPMDMLFFNYGLKPEFRSQVATNLATGLYPAIGTDTYLNHLLGSDLRQVVKMSNDPRFMETICPAGNIYTTAEQAGRFFEMLLNGGVYQDKQIFSEKTILNAIHPTTRQAFDRSLLIPMNYGSGPMLGANPVGLYGPMTRHAFGHIGFFNIFGWADPARDISVTLLTTGKSVFGTHLPALAKVLYQISTQCPHIPRWYRRPSFRMVPNKIV